MKITNSVHKKMGLPNEEMIKENLMKKTCNGLVKEATENFWIKLITLKN